MWYYLCLFYCQRTKVILNELYFNMSGFCGTSFLSHYLENLLPINNINSMSVRLKKFKGSDCQKLSITLSIIQFSNKQY